MNMKKEMIMKISNYQTKLLTELVRKLKSNKPA